MLAIEKLAPISSEINRLMKHHDYIDNILLEGANKANEIALPIISKTYEIIGLLSSTNNSIRKNK